MSDIKAESQHVEKSDHEVDDEVETNIPWSAWAVVFAVSFSWFAQSMYLVAAGYFTTEISASIGGAGVSLWLPQAFQVMAACLGPLLATWGDSIGRRYFLLFGAGMGFVGVVVMSTAKTMNIAILGSCLFGFLFSNTANIFSIASEVVPRRHRGTAQIATNLGSTSGLTLGAILGGVFITHTGSWRGVFYLSGGCLGLSLILLAIFYNPPPPPNPLNLSVRQRLLAVDFIGVACLTLGIVPLMMALVWGGQTYTWGSKPIIALLTVGCVFLAILLVHQVFFEKHGLFDHDVFTNRNVILTFIGLFVEGMIFISYNVLYGEETAAIYETRVLYSALRYSSFTLCDLAFCFLYGYIAWRFRRVKEVLAWGYTLFIAATIGLVCATPGSTKAVIAYAAIAGTGFSAPIALLVTVAQLAVHPRHIGLVTALLVTARSVGGSVGTAIASAVYQSKLAAKVPAYISKAATQGGLPTTSLAEFVADISAGSANAASTLPGSSPILAAAGKTAYVQAQSDSFRYAWAVLVPFLVIALIGVLLLHPVKQLMTPLVERPVDRKITEDEVDLTAVRHHHGIEETRPV